MSASTSEKGFGLAGTRKLEEALLDRWKILIVHQVKEEGRWWRFSKNMALMLAEVPPLTVPALSLICLMLYYRDTVALSQVLSLHFGAHRAAGQIDAQRNHGLAGDTEC